MSQMVKPSIVTGTNLFLFLFRLKRFGINKIEQNIPESQLCFCFLIGIQIGTHPPSRFKSTLSCLWGFVRVQVLVRIPCLFCVRGVFMVFRVQAAVENCRIRQLHCAFTGECVVKYVKETCETVHSIQKRSVTR